MKRRVGLIAILMLVTLFAFGGVRSVSAATTVVVSPANTHGWTFVTEGPIGSGTFVNGPGNPPLGTGSVNLTVDGAGREIISNPTYAGMKLADVNVLQYSTYANTSGPANAYDISLQFDMFGTSGYLGRAVYEPYQNAMIVQGQWQTWNPLQGVWWQSHTATGPCSQSAPCSWPQFNALFPNTTIGSVLLRAGGPWPPGFSGSADALTVGLKGQTPTTYDFELYTVPTDKDQCKNDGYKTFTPPGGPFKNQGECVSFVEHHDKGEHSNGGDDGDGGNAHHGTTGDGT